AHSIHHIPIDYWPSEYATFSEYAEAYGLTGYVERIGSAMAINWHPYNLHYQVTTIARNPMHHMDMTGQLLGTEFLPDRWGRLDIPADRSCRMLYRVGS